MTSGLDEQFYDALVKMLTDPRGCDRVEAESLLRQLESTFVTPEDTSEEES